MYYKFYDKEALKKSSLDKLNYRFGISSNDYDELIMEKNLDTSLLFHLLTKMGSFDIIEVPENYNYGCTIYPGTPQVVLNALYYDREYHPDEVVFVTTDKELAKIANKYFGDDSIRVIKG